MRKHLEGRLTINDIIDIAGPWHNLLRMEFDKHALGQEYDRETVNTALTHLKKYYDPQVYKFYQEILDEEDNINGP